MPKKPRQAPINLKVDADLKASLRQMARERSYRANAEITLSHLVREALEQYVARAGDVPADRQVAEDHAKYGTAE